MTRRPYAPHAQRVARASQNLTAPGKKWSESPTTQLGPTRKPRTVASSPMPVSPYDWEGWDADYDRDNIGVITFNYQNTQPGWEHIAVAIGVRTKIGLPTGWSALADVSVGAWLNVKVAHIVSTTSDDGDIDWDFQIESGYPYADYAAPEWASNVQMMDFSPTETSGTPQLSVSSESAVTSIYPARPDASWTSQWQVVVMTTTYEQIGNISYYNYDRQQTYGYDPADNAYPVSKTVVQRINAPSEPPAVGDGPIVPTIINAGGLTADWITIGLGWL